jgi:hypothetical protein
MHQQVNKVRVPKRHFIQSAALVVESSRSENDGKQIESGSARAISLVE